MIPTLVRKTLTERIVREAKPGPEAYVMWDTELPGLGCGVYLSGFKSHVLLYQSGGRKRQATFGRRSDMSLREVRRHAAAEPVRIRDGELGPLERLREERQAPRVDDALASFFSKTVPDRIEAGRFIASGGSAPPLIR